MQGVPELTWYHHLAVSFQQSLDCKGLFTPGAVGLHWTAIPVQYQNKTRQNVLSPMCPVHITALRQCVMKATSKSLLLGKAVQITKL